MTTTKYETTAGTEPDGEVQHEARTIKRIGDSENPETIYMMTEIGDGTFVQWSDCRRCNKRVGECACPDGPKEADYITRWRTQRFAQSFADRGIEPRADTYAVRELMEAVQQAQDAAYGDSNDEEIDLLRDALGEALRLLGLNLPDGHDPDSDDENAVEHAELTRDKAVPAVETRVDSGLEAALERVREQKGEPDVGF